MTKKEIVKHIAEQTRQPQLQTKRIVDMTFDAIVAALVTEGRIELRNFGVFVVKTRKPRRARNPRTNEQVEVEAKNVVTFQPGKLMEERVRRVPAAYPVKKGRKKLATPATVGGGAGFSGNGRHETADLPRKPR